MSVKESYIEAELYRIFKNAIETTPEFFGVTFTDIKDRMKVSSGEADIVIFGKVVGEPFTIVIETKKRGKKYDQRLDPYSITVIGQALGYAAALQSRLIATTNGDIFVIFDVNKQGTILQRRVGKSYKVEMSQNFALSVFRNISLYLTGRLETVELGDAFIERLRYFHALISPLVYDSLEEELLTNRAFDNTFSKWLKEQGFSLTNAVKHNVAEQAAYLIMNRIIFYKTLESYQKNLKLLPLVAQSDEEFNPKALQDRIEDWFKYIVSSIDYEAVFIKSNIFDEIPYSEPLLSYLNDFIRDIEQYTLSEINRDVIGEVYQRLIPIDERKRLGQYYTPNQVSDLITRFCIRNSDDAVLDPSCGSGGFLVSSYERLKIINNPIESAGNLHNKILSQIYGVDINQFAAHLSVINLTMRDVRSNSKKINVLSTDFFRIPALQAQIGIEHEAVSIANTKTSSYLLPVLFDSIVANPPYTRQDEIGDKNYIDSIRENALTFFEPKTTRKKGRSYSTKKYDMSSEAGIYAYFFTHSTHFLKEGGLMGFIVYNSWLDVKYGHYLQKFLLENFRIIAILDFDKRVFSDASVNTVVVLLEKATGKGKASLRDSNVTKFVRVKKTLSSDVLLNYIERARSSYEDDTLGIVAVPQNKLRREDKWGHYLKAPPLFYKLQEKIKTKVSDVAAVTIGYVTLSNDFFIIGRDQAEGLGIEPEFLKPLILNTREIQHLDVTRDDCAKYLFMVNRDTGKLYGSFAKRYIENAERKDIEITRGHEKGKIVTGYQNLPALKDKKVWYELTPRTPEPILVPVLVWDRWFAVWNRDAIYTTQNFCWIRPNQEEDLFPLLALLNSTVTEFFVEVLGKSGYGEGVLELMKHNLEDISILDPKLLGQKDRKILSNQFQRLRKESRLDRNVADIRREIDVIIFDALGIDQSELSTMYENLKTMRENRKNKVNTDVMLK